MDSETETSEITLVINFSIGFAYSVPKIIGNEISTIGLENTLNSGFPNEFHAL
jgi:hypothetical protein